MGYVIQTQRGSAGRSRVKQTGLILPGDSMATFSKADKDIVDLVSSAMREYHRPLAEAGVRVDALMAHAARDSETGEPKGPAIRLHGYPCYATIRITSQKERVAGLGDAMLTLDGDRWSDLTAEQQRALLDHELAHLVLVTEDGMPQTDDCFRPKLRSRPHDAQLGIFWDVVERHQANALESVGYRDVHKQFTQLCFPWG